MSNHILDKINHHISYHKEDKLLNHLITILKYRRVKYSGIIKETNFILWRYSNWIGIFYPVIYGIFEDNKVILKTKINKLGRIISILIYLGWCYGTIAGIIFQEYFWKLLFIRSIACLILIIIPLIAFYFPYKLIKNSEIEDLEKILNN